MGNAITFLESDRAKRVCLADRVPMDKPFTIRISPCRICDLRCEFCHQSLEEYRAYARRIGTSGLMDMSFYRRVIDDIKDTFGSVVKIVFVGRGEPILHPGIAQMVAYAAEKQAADQIEIVTNGVSLTHELCDQLIEAGLTTLRISVNGLNAEDYLKFCGKQIDFEKFIEQVRYFYTHKKDTSIYVKIINYMVDTPQRRECFYQMFSPICDIINIENLYETNMEIDFQKFMKEPQELLLSANAEGCIQTEICASPFYSLQMDEDGLVQPCSSPILYSEEKCLGDAKRESMRNIWFQKSYRFQRQMLDGMKKIPFCEGCRAWLPHTHPEDVLDDAAERLKTAYDAKRSRKG